MKAFAEKKYKVADGAFQQVLSNLGITDSASIKVNIDKEGQINVSSNLSKQANDRLQTALNDSQTFSQAFRAAASTKETIAATERHLEFATAYAQDPKAAVARYGIGSKSPAGQAFFTYSEGASSLEYEDPFVHVSDSQKIIIKRRSGYADPFSFWTAIQSIIFWRKRQGTYGSGRQYRQSTAD